MGALRILCAVLCFAIIVKAHNVKPLPSNRGSSSLSAFSKFYKHCENVDDIFLCIKQQALKLASRALKLQTITIVDGVSLLRRDDMAKASNNDVPTSEEELRNLSSDEIDGSLLNSASKLLTNFQLQLNLPKVFENSQNEVSQFAEEGRKKRKKYLGPFLAAMAIKAGVLKLAYHSIAIVAAKALSKFIWCGARWVVDMKQK